MRGYAKFAVIMLALLFLIPITVSATEAQVEVFCKQTPDPDYNVRVRDAELCFFSRATEFAKDNLALRNEVTKLQTLASRRMQRIVDLEKTLATTVAEAKTEKTSLLQQLANSQAAFFQSRSGLASAYESIAAENENIIVALGIFMVIAGIAAVSGLTRKRKTAPNLTGETPNHAAIQTDPTDHVSSLEKEVMHLTGRVTELNRQAQEAAHQGMRLAIKGGKGTIGDSENPSGVAYEFDAICCPGGEKHPKHRGMAVVKIKNLRDHFVQKVLPNEAPLKTSEQAEPETAAATA